MLPRRTATPSQSKRSSTLIPSLQNPAGRDLLGFALVIGLGGLLLAIVAFRSDTERPETVEHPYQHAGTFQYSASAPEGVYDRPGISTGEPIFRNLTSAFNVQFDYELTSNAPMTAGGIASLMAEIQSQNGWKRTFELSPPTDFDGTSTSIAGVVDLDQVQRAIDRMEAESGLEARSYVLQIQALVETGGEVAGQVVDETFAPAISFQLDDQQVQFTEASRAEGDALNPRAGDAVSRITMVPDSIKLGPVEPAVSTARTIAVAVLGAALLVIVVVLIGTAQDRRRGDVSRDIAGFEDRIVEIQSNRGWPSTAVTEVETFEDFKRLAQLVDGPIYHYADAGGDSYVLGADGERYRFHDSHTRETEAHAGEGGETLAANQMAESARLSRAGHDSRS